MLEGQGNTIHQIQNEPTDLLESWSHKEFLYNRSRLINHGDKIIPAIHKELYILPRPLKAMTQWKIRYMQKEVYILSKPRKFQYMRKEVYILSRPSKLQPVADYSIVTQYTPREKDQYLPQLPSTLEAQEMYQYTHKEPATVVSQALIASCERRVDQCKMVIIPRVYRRTRTMLKIRCTYVRQTRHSYSQLTEPEKAKFQTPSTSNEARNYVEHNSVENISQDLVHLTKSDTASAPLISESEEREEIAETADVPAPTPAPAPALERVKEQSHTPGSRKSMRKNLGRPASS